MYHTLRLSGYFVIQANNIDENKSPVPVNIASIFGIDNLARLTPLSDFELASKTRVFSCPISVLEIMTVFVPLL